MTFQESIQVCLQKFADFTGRASRSEYWWWTLFNFLVCIGTSLALGPNLASFASVALILPSIAVAIRRLHDLDRSGWFLLLSLIPVIGALVLLYWFTQAGKGPNQYGEAA
ncbi:DUF805 domain-containing protein [Chitinibacter bivalviorum]|uniref:DUF805 domain-containing protein n=1 Tax=Chitinibacter bivalviorum TaxID=2739434 RepID=A0A7H9BJE2_9NEIS|nr:DUF805 domain-containing protein [Chitinibacter bivalviorum]QLG88787.1 DUF805 domain-containing protein [Chitinibacter bivalviorum]